LKYSWLKAHYCLLLLSVVLALLLVFFYIRMPGFAVISTNLTFANASGFVNATALGTSFLLTLLTSELNGVANITIAINNPNFFRLEIMEFLATVYFGPFSAAQLNISSPVALPPLSSANATLTADIAINFNQFVEQVCRLSSCHANF
jgi:hypothetical protein